MRNVLVNVVLNLIKIGSIVDFSSVQRMKLFHASHRFVWVFIVICLHEIIDKCISKFKRYCTYLYFSKFVVKLEFEEVFAVDLTNIIDLKQRIIESINEENLTKVYVYSIRGYYGFYEDFLKWKWKKKA